jgi:hypothetical protein
MSKLNYDDLTFDEAMAYPDRGTPEAQRQYMQGIARKRLGTTDPELIGGHRAVFFVGMESNEGLEFGLDPVTPVAFKFYRTRPPKIRYVWALPDDVVRNQEFQHFAANCNLMVCSFNDLKAKLSVFRRNLL